MNTAIQRSEFSHFMRKLQARAAALRTEIRETLLRADNEQYVQLAGQVHDAGDESLADLLVDVNLSEVSRDVEEIRDIEAALRRIATGAYGVCMACKEPIDRERLEVYPTAKRCLKCQQAHDRARAMSIPPSF
jgi:DnaK suppressor protein